MLTGAKFGRDSHKSKRWIVIALCAAVFYAAFGYFCGQYRGNAISGKVTSSFISGIAALIVQVY